MCFPDPEAKVKPVQQLEVSGRSDSELTVSWDQYSCTDLPARFLDFIPYIGHQREIDIDSLSARSFTFTGLQPITLYQLHVDVVVVKENENTARSTVWACTRE